VDAQDRAVVDLVPQVLDPVRILTDERGRERVVAQRRDGAQVERGATERTGPVALDAFVRRQLDERRLAAELVPGTAANPVLFGLTVSTMWVLTPVIFIRRPSGRAP
jgi:hypothetical protein